MGNLRGQGDLVLLRVHCQRLQRHTVACTRSVLAICESQDSGAMLGFSLDLFIVVRCIARSTKLLRREVRICAMFRNVERRVGGSLRMKPQSHQGKIPLFKHRWVAPAAALVTTTGLDLLKCTSYINYQIFTSKRRSENYYLKITGTHLIMVFLLKRLTLNRNQGA